MREPPPHGELGSDGQPGQMLGEVLLEGIGGLQGFGDQVVVAHQPT